MEMNTLSVAVCGAGIGGVAASLALRQRGADVTIYERSPRLEEVGAGLQIGPNGMAVLDALGLGPDIRTVGTRPEAIELVDHRRGARLMHVPLGDAAERRWGAPYLHLHRADLLGALVNAAKKAGVQFEMNAAASHRAGRSVHLKDGRTVTPDIIVGADGVRSTLRQQMWDGQPVRFTGQVAWRALVPADRLEGWTLPPRTLLTLGPGKHVVLYRLRQGALINVVAVEEREDWTEEDWSLPGDPGVLRSRFTGWNPTVERVLGAVEETYQWGLFEHPVLPHLTEDNLALLGDAAHPMLPFLAQGAVMALEDGWVLAEALADASSIEGGLSTFNARRHPRATRVQREASGQARLYHASGPLRPVLHTGMRLVGTLMPDFGARRYDWMFGTSVVD
jgi:salicylate hydroxylase